MVAAGAWVDELLPVDDRPPAVHRQPRGADPLPSPRPSQRWPSFVHYLDGAANDRAFGAYGLETPGEGVKVGVEDATSVRRGRGLRPRVAPGPAPRAGQLDRVPVHHHARRALRARTARADRGVLALLGSRLQVHPGHRHPGGRPVRRSAPDTGSATPDRSHRPVLPVCVLTGGRLRWGWSTGAMDAYPPGRSPRRAPAGCWVVARCWAWPASPAVGAVGALVVRHRRGTARVVVVATPDRRRGADRAAPSDRPSSRRGGRARRLDHLPGRRRHPCRLGGVAAAVGGRPLGLHDRPAAARCRGGGAGRAGRGGHRARHQRRPARPCPLATSTVALDSMLGLFPRGRRRGGDGEHHVRRRRLPGPGPGDQRPPALVRGRPSPTGTPTVGREMAAGLARRADHRRLRAPVAAGSAGAGRADRRRRCRRRCSAPDQRRPGG